MNKHKYIKDNITSKKRNNKKTASSTRIDYLSFSSKSQTCSKEHSSSYIKIKPAPMYSLSLLYKLNHNKINSNLSKHNVTKERYEKIIINNIIYDEKKHIVSLFKNHLLWDETSDFLKRFYNKQESISRLPQICAYYEEYSIFIPVYFSLNVGKIMLKNKKRKKKVMENNEEQDNTNSKISKGVCYTNQILSYFIKPEEVNSDEMMTGKSLSMSQLSYAIKRIAESDRLNYNFKSDINNNISRDNLNNNANVKDKEISLTEYNDNTIDGNDLNINDLINNISIQCQHQYSHLHQQGLNENKENKKNVSNKNPKKNTTSYIEMKKLNLGSINNHNNGKNKQQAISIGNLKKQLFKCKTERISQCKSNTKLSQVPKKSIPRSQKPNKTNGICHTYRQNHSMNSTKKLYVPEYNRSALSNKKSSVPQSTFYRKLTNTKKNLTQRSNKSPDDMLNLRNHKLILSNTTYIRKIKPFIKENTTYNINNTKRNQSKKSKVSHLDNSSITERNKKETIFQTRISPIITPKSLIITKLTKNASSKVTIPIENIKVNLKCYPCKYIKPDIAPLINNKYSTNVSKSKLTTTATMNDYQRYKNKAIKSYIAKRKWNNSSATERKDSQCNSRNSYIRNSLNSQHTKLIRIVKKNRSQLKKPNKSPIFPYNNFSNNTKGNNMKNKTTRKQTTNPTIISEINNEYPLTSRNEIESIPFNIVNKLIHKITT